MKKYKGPETELKKLRKHAKKRLLERTADIETMPSEDINKLIQELEVHQIELEIQNEELRSAQLQLEAERNKYTDLYDFAPVGYFTISDKGLILEANLTGAQLLKIERCNLINSKFSRFIAPEYQDRFYLHRRDVLRSKTNQACDLQIVTQDDTQFYAQLESVAIKDNAQKNSQFRTAVSDISDQMLSVEALRHSEEKYRLLFEEMMSGFALREIIFDSRGKPVDARILDVNPAYEQITGLKKEHIIGKTVLEVLPETESYWFENFAKVFLTGMPIQFENYHKGLDKHLFVAAFKYKNNQVAIHFTDITDRKKAEIELQKAHAELEKRILERTANLAASNASLKQEIADRKQAEEALEEERQRLFSVFDEMPAFIYLEAPNHSIRFANRYFREHFGDYEGKKCYELLKGIKEPCKECPTLRILENGKAQEWESGEFRDGRIYQIYDYPFTDVDGSQLVLELGIDITKRKQAESEMRRLASRLLNAQEDERKKIAFELHDELGQDLTVLKLHINSIKRKLQADQSELQKAFDDVLLEINQTIEKVRRISRDLSPSVLVDLGLNAALRWMLKSFAKHSNIEISIHIPDTKNLFSTQQQIAVYRIFQEIVTNISKHAHATKVSIVGQNENSNVSFRVKDNGIGFDIDQVNVKHAPKKGLGLEAMEERVKMLEGHFEIFSQVNTGTQIAFEVPIDSSP